ncbi:MAG: tRNA (adenosine(37)-N6)-threonylcarbamoyltransferase complex dimerization subunit type 1 TsaB [Synergistaceae bacterium]|nr:tRNA (adenosine(37)-N6)-threonylcarbamoyltransferase complex dimerization subunit type 1 TsaB [Synergistaceae bacterium]
MSNILAIDCCLRVTGIGLMIDDSVAACEQEDLGRRQSAELPLMAERVMNGLAWDSLDYVALTNGPGYFTGIRVGAAYASGIAYASRAKIIPVSSLEMLAESSGLSASQKILAVVYAGHGFVYAECRGFLEAGEYSLQAINDWLAVNPEAEVISDAPERAGLDALSVRPRIETLCGLAYKRLDSAISPLELKIKYYRAPQGVN